MLRRVDEDPDAGVIAQTRLDGGQLAGLCEVGLEDIDGDSMGLAQTSRQGVQSRLVAGDQHEVMAALREALGVGGADAGGGAGDEDSGTGGHVLFS